MSFIGDWFAGAPADSWSWSLLLAVAGVTLSHTLLSPDHYVPFVAMARARGWSGRRAAWVTGLCGAGHVAFSLLLAVTAVWLGAAATGLERFDRIRGAVAAWGLVAFGVAFAALGLRQMGRGTVAGTRAANASAVRAPAAAAARGLGLVIALFILRPAEPLVPLLMLPTCGGDWSLAVAATFLSAIVTIGAMVGVTLAALRGLGQVRLGLVERWTVPIVGASIAATGLAVIVLRT